MSQRLNITAFDGNFPCQAALTGLSPLGDARKHYNDVRVVISSTRVSLLETIAIPRRAMVGKACSVEAQLEKSRPRASSKKGMEVYRRRIGAFGRAYSVLGGAFKRLV